MKKILTLAKGLKWELSFIALVAIVTLTFFLKFSVILVDGNSMYPTFKDGEYLLITKSSLKDNQIVVFDHPESWDSKKSKFIKRVVATEGDYIEIDNNTLKVNEKKEIDISKKNCELSSSETFKIPKDKILVMGDNTANSNDSITQFCEMNDEFLVDKSDILVSGESKVIYKKQ